MQTGLPLLDSSVFGASFKGQQTLAGGTTKPTADAKSDQLAGFMEIMGALLALPPEQWKSSLTGFDSMSADGCSEALPCLSEKTEKNVNPTELLTLLLNMKGEDLQEFQSAEAEGRLRPLLDMAKALIDDPQIADLGSLEAYKQSLGAELAQGDNPGTLLSQAENAVQDGLEVEIQGDEESRLFPGMDQGTEKSKNPLLVEAKIDSQDKAQTDVPPALTLETLQEDAPKPSRQTKRVNDCLFKTSDGQTVGTPGDRAPDETDRLIEKKFQTPAVEDVKSAGLDAQRLVEGENLEERLVQRPGFQAGAHQGLLWRPEAGQDSKAMTLSGDKEVMLQDKTDPSQVIRQIVQRMSMHSVGAQSKMVIRLKPEFLGNVHMQVLTENQQVTVRMMADSTLVKDIVEQNLPHLRAELQHHGLEIQKFDVFVANDDQGWRGGQEQAGFRDTRDQKQSRPDSGKTKRQNRRIMLDAGDGKKIVKKDPGEIDYFA